MSTYTEQNGIPSRAYVRDVTLRDGFQNIKEWIPTERKIAVLDALAATGVGSIEVTSFVSPKAIAQMADAPTVLAHLKKHYPSIEAVALVPNLHGAQAAVEHGADCINYVISATEEHNKANINRTQAESLTGLAAIKAAFPNLRITFSMSTAFGCPFRGETPVASVIQLLKGAVDQGIHSVTLCDTIGVANPAQVKALLSTVQPIFPDLPFSVHFHDTHGMGLANTLAALQAGIDSFETAAGGLGGCPFAPGAAGNTATEDMLNMLHRMGIATDIRLEHYLKVPALIQKTIQPNLSGRFAAARNYLEFHFYTPQA